MDIEFGSVAAWLALAVPVLLAAGIETWRRRRSHMHEATKVAIWVDRIEDQWFAMVRNATDSSIHSVVMSFGDPDDVRGLSHYWRPVIPAGETIRWDIEYALPVACMAEPRAEVRFTDSRGRHWLRDEHGKAERRKYRALDPGDERNWEAIENQGDGQLLPAMVSPDEPSTSEDGQRP